MHFYGFGGHAEFSSNVGVLLPVEAVHHIHRALFDGHGIDSQLDMVVQFFVLGYTIGLLTDPGGYLMGMIERGDPPVFSPDVIERPISNRRKQKCPE